MKEKIIEHVRQLLAHASDPGASPNEAEIATRLATKLMMKHGIEEAMLQGGKISIGYGYTQKLELEFAGILAIGTAKLLGTIVQCINKQSQEGSFYRCYKFGGEVSDVKLSVWLCETMVASAIRACKEKKSQETPEAFLNGYAAAVQARMFVMAKTKEAQENELKISDSNALMVLDQKLVKIEEKFGKQDSAPIKSALGSEGWVAGQKANIPTGALETKNQSLLS